MSEVSENAPIQAGGVGKHFASLDFTTEKDRGLLRTAMKWWPARYRGLDDEFKAETVKDLQISRETARKVAANPETADMALRACATLSSVAKTVVMMEDQVQKDQHLQDKNARLDAGLLTERVAVEPVIGRKAILPPEARP